jgi:hypothetical protein
MTKDTRNPIDRRPDIAETVLWWRTNGVTPREVAMSIGLKSPSKADWPRVIAGLDTQAPERAEAIFGEVDGVSWRVGG